MAKKIINLTIPIVIEEIEFILETYPKYPYQQVFSPSSGLRQYLIAYVVNRVPNKYVLVEETQSSSNQIALPNYSSERLLDIENWIHLGIRELIDIYNTTNNYMPETVNS